MGVKDSYFSPNPIMSKQDRRNKTISEFRPVHSPIGVPNSQVPRYFVAGKHTQEDTRRHYNKPAHPSLSLGGV